MVTLYQGDVLERLAELPDESVHCVVTSPPYWGLRDYSTVGQLGLEATPEEHVAAMVAVFREVRRVLRRDGTLWLNYGDGYQDKQLCGMPWRVAFALQADGWWLRSDIIWSKPNPMPESVTDRPTKAHEYLFLLSKAPTYYYDADAVREAASENTHSRGSGIGVKNAETPFGLGVKHNEDYANRINGHVSARNKRTVWEIATEPYPEAHFATFPTALVKPPILAGTSERGCCAECGAPWERVVDVEGETPRERQVRQGQSAYAAAQPRNPQGLDYAGGHGNGLRPRTTTGWRPTCTHEARVRACTVLDPFSGSGTTAAVAKALGRKAIGIELNEEYLRLSVKRIQAVTLPLLGMEP